MNKKYTAEDVVKIMGAPLASVKALYAKNAKDLRQSAVKAGTGKYRGFTAKWYNDAADHAEAQAK
jgi:hypothetical protein